jgi:phage gp36-like protein
MAYSTRADLVRRVGGDEKLVQLADLDNDGAEDAGVVDAAIAEADGLINSYAKKRHAVPIANPSPELVAASARIAARAIKSWKNVRDQLDIDDEKTDRAWLRDIADGKVAVTATPSPEKSELVVDKAEPRESTKTVSREKFKGFC